MNSFVEKLLSIKGKTIENICANTDEINKAFDPIVLYFTDGSEITFSAIEIKTVTGIGEITGSRVTVE